MKFPRLLPFALTTCAVGFAAIATADIYVFNFDHLVTGDTPNGYSWATLTVSDNGPDNVLVRLDHNATSTSGQFITQLWFNLDPFTPVAQQSKTPSNKFGTFTASQDGVGTAGIDFDLFQTFQTSNAGGGVNRLKPGEFVTFELVGSGLTASDFLSTSSGNGEFLGMIHLQGIDGGGSAKISSVPEPATLGALGVGLAALLRRRKANRRA